MRPTNCTLHRIFEVLFKCIFVIDNKHWIKPSPVIYMYKWNLIFCWGKKNKSFRIITKCLPWSNWNKLNDTSYMWATTAAQYLSHMENVREVSVSCGLKGLLNIFHILSILVLTENTYPTITRTSAPYLTRLTLSSLLNDTI